MTRPTGSSRINTSWQSRINEAIRLLTIIDQAFGADRTDYSALSRQPNLHDAIHTLQALNLSSTNKDADAAVHQATKHILYALGLRVPANR